MKLFLLLSIIVMILSLLIKIFKSIRLYWNIISNPVIFSGLKEVMKFSNENKDLYKTDKQSYQQQLENLNSLHRNQVDEEFNKPIYLSLTESLTKMEILSTNLFYVSGILLLVSFGTWCLYF